ncbi:Periplasmic dipeptide transport protein precursor (Dipeptide-binding protein) (DBP) [Candidatus Glomeribacter gigasporarum BEG34]|uniref:Periplasmic dipeptide transport protein (Dipeptide-binding protein) (DBP) n=2 Tax=Candidatus Glomeribacter gigasporarum TaxID=132144 RepID=G2J946_9BURK|nr:Periplasmic dipeptide transport protein precursor (Dipeptide-binding protein) (DBP) [Candidatus Glomeribacter gigasporarum BEG34]
MAQKNREQNSYNKTSIMNTSNSIAAIPDKTLNYCSEASPIGFDANQARTIPDHTASSVSLYNRLLEFERGGTKLEPGLAESWDISKDGKVYTFHLRRGVKFHSTPWFKPTREFNAEDVLFTFERMRNPNMPFRKAYPVEFTDFHHLGLDNLISRIEALDEGHAIRFTLNTVHAPFLVKLAAPVISILSAEYAAKLLKEGNPSDISWKPIGTGPFIFQEYIKDATIRFRGNPEYWKPDEVQLSRLIFDIVPDAAVRAQKLKANECQVVTSLRSTDIPVLKHDPGLRALSQPGFNVRYLIYNTAHKPLDDVRVRRALEMAIDKKALINQVYEGRAQIAVAPLPPLQWSYDKTLQDAPRDLKQAKALLAQAGYPNGFKFSLWIPHSSIGTNVNPRLTAEIIQSDWKEMGVEAKIVGYEWGEFIKRAINGKHDVLLIGIISNIPDPENLLKVFSCTEIGHGFNLSRWCHSSFDDLIQRAAQTLDIAERSQLYTQAQKLLKREQPVTPLAYAINYQVVNKHVTGFKINPLGPTIFSGVGLK